LGFFKSIQLKVLSDEKLVSQVRNGVEKAFEVLYKRYAKRMLFFFTQKLQGDQQLAQDFLQDLFIKILEKLDTYNVEKSFAVWIYSIANNMCKNHYRKVGRSTVEWNANSAMLYETSSDFGHDDSNEVFLKRLNLALESMEESYREIYTLRYRENLTIQEISEFLQCPQGTVKSRLHYAIKALSAIINKQPNGN